MCFREARLERSFSLRCSHCADVGFLSDCHSLAVRSTTMRFCSFSTAQVRFVEKGQRQTHGAENSVGGASRFDADAHAPRRQVFATKTRSRKNASERRKRTRCASRSDSLKLVVSIFVEAAERRAAPTCWSCRKVWCAIHMANAKSDAAATV